MFSKTKLAASCGAFALTLSTCVSAAQLSLANSPLVVAQSVDPNIMILFDTSGSMEDNASLGDFDSGVNYDQSCSDKLPTHSSVTGGAYHYRANVDANGDVTIDRSIYSNFSSYVNNYTWGTSGSASCFSKNGDYRVVFGDTYGVFEDYYAVKGNFLNWYFSDETQSGPANFGAGNVQRAGVGSRNSVAIRAMRDLIGEAGDSEKLENARVGIAGFDTSGSNNEDTAKIHSKLVDIDVATNRSALLSTIESMPASGSTPLTSSLAALGRYFVEGHDDYLDTDQDGVVDGSGDTDETASTLFSHAPTYGGTLVEPAAGEVMQWSCQKNFIIAMTDGEPTTEGTYNDDLAKWDDGTVCSSNACKAGSGTTDGDFDDVAAALYDLDLRPGWPDVKNNVTTFPIGFGVDMGMLENAATLANSQYYPATNASALSAALKAIARKIQAQVSTVASVAFNSGRLIAGSSVFQGKFNTDGYSGQLLSYPLASDGSIGQAQAWDAGQQLAAMTPANRKIFTYNTADSDGVEFAWANLSPAQQNDLSYPAVATDPADATEPAVVQGQKILSFLRGDNSHGDLRSRDADESLNYSNDKFVLGDIVNSTPVFVGSPELNWPDHVANTRFGAAAANYSDYKSSAASRTPVVYVGANDGMLHGFNAANGNEVFAYVPGALYSSDAVTSGLHYLADSDYTHRFYVDLTPAVSDVFIPNTDGGASAWRTVLVGGLRAGGRGLFALDVSSPTAFSDPGSNAADVVLWEFSSDDDVDLGYTYSQPTIAMMPNDRWAAIVGNGYNSDAENAHLFVIFLDGGLDGTWTAGTDYIKIQAGTADSNGLSTPRVVDLNGDSVADRAYAGDLQGNMWAFDLSDADESEWGVAHVSGGTDQPLFAANNGSEAQPITAAPVLAKNSEVTAGTSQPNVLVLFGTGKFLEPDDADSNFELQSYYGVWDSGTGGLARANLLERQLITKTETFTDPTAGTTVTKRLRESDDSNGDIDWTTHSGWFMDLETKASLLGTATEDGERVVTASLLRREVLLFNTIIPDSVACSGGGSGWLMSLDYLSGLAPSFATFDANGDGQITAADIGYVGEQFLEGLPSQSGVLGDMQYTPGSKGVIETREIEVGKGSKEGRLSWEELLRN